MTCVTARRLACLLAVSGVLLLGCSDDDSDADASADETTTESTEAASETTAAEEDEESTTESTEAGSDTTEAAAGGEDITEPVTTAYTTFFLNFSGDVSLLEDGDSFAADIPELTANAAETGTISVNVNGVTALEDADCDLAGTIAPCAEVAFDLVVNDEVVVPDQTGYAVYQDDTWKVAKTTFCSLAAMGSGPPEAC